MAKALEKCRKKGAMFEHASLDGNDLSDEAARDLLVASGCADTFLKERSKRSGAPENATDTDTGTSTSTGTGTGTGTVDTGEQEHIQAWGATEQEGKDDDKSERRNSGTTNRTAQRHPLLQYKF